MASLIFDTIIDHVGEVICRLQSTSTSVWELKEGDLKFLPLSYMKQYISSTELQKVWSKLPERYRRDKELQLNLPCYKHYNQPGVSAHLDGPPPSIRKCCGIVTKSEIRKVNKKVCNISYSDDSIKVLQTEESRSLSDGRISERNV